MQYLLSRHYVRGLQNDFVRHHVASLVNQADSQGEMIRRAQEAEGTRSVARRDDNPGRIVSEQRFAGLVGDQVYRTTWQTE